MFRIILMFALCVLIPPVGVAWMAYATYKYWVADDGGFTPWYERDQEEK